MRRARRPRSARSTRPDSDLLGDALGELDGLVDELRARAGGVLAHLVRGSSARFARRRSARGRPRPRRSVRLPLPRRSSVIGSSSVDPVGARVLPEAEEDHLRDRGICHERIMQLRSVARWPRIYLSPPHLSGRELDLLRDAIESNWVAPLGPQVDAFEQELAERRRACRTRSRCRAAPPRSTSRSIVLGIGPGDEVACSVAHLRRPARTRSSTPARRRSSSTATRTTWTIDPDAPRRRRSHERAGASAAVVAVDLYGQCCDYDALDRGLRAARRHPRPGRGRVARRDLPRRAGRRPGRRSRPSRSTATR